MISKNKSLDGFADAKLIKQKKQWHGFGNSIFGAKEFYNHSIIKKYDHE